MNEDQSTLPPSDSEPPPKQLRRSVDDRVLAGVCGGIGQYFNVDTVLVRVLFVLLTFMGGTGPILYVVMWLVMPEKAARA